MPADPSELIPGAADLPDGTSGLLVAVLWAAYAFFRWRQGRDNRADPSPPPVVGSPAVPSPPPLTRAELDDVMREFGRERNAADARVLERLLAQGAQLLEEHRRATVSLEELRRTIEHDRGVTSYQGRQIDETLRSLAASAQSHQAVLAQIWHRLNPGGHPPT